MDARSTPELMRQRAFWTRDKEDRLIGLYSQFSLLWDCRHKHYYKRDRRDHAMHAIAEALNNEFDVESVKAKIKNMRDYFIKELQKEHATARSPPSERYFSRWEHFNAWHFLRRVIYSVPAAPHTVNVPQARSSRVRINQKPNMPTLSGQRGTLNPSLTSEAHSNSVLTSAADARGQDGAGYGSWAESLDLPSKDTYNALFCGQLIKALRKMPRVQRDYAKLRFMQILFDVKYKA